MEFSSRAAAQVEAETVLTETAKRLLEVEDIDWQSHGALTLARLSLSRIFYYADIYKQIISVPGHVMEFGVQYGTTISLLTNLRSLFEPFNISRRIVGFDSFAGLGTPHHCFDGDDVGEGDWSVPDGWHAQLASALDAHRQFGPAPHVTKTELVIGTVETTLPTYLEETSGPVALAILDLDLYEPTRFVLEAIRDRLVPGSILVFDEFMHSGNPGEARAVHDVFGFGHLDFQRNQFSPHSAYAVWGSSRQMNNHNRH